MITLIIQKSRRKLFFVPDKPPLKLCYTRFSPSQITLVSYLFFPGGPSDVTLFIIAIIIYPVNCIFRRGTLPNFCQKLRKTVKAEFDPSTTIILKLSIIYAFTTRLGCVEGDILNRVFIPPVRTQIGFQASA